MWRNGATVLVLRPGRETLRIQVPRRWPWYAAAVLLSLSLMGAAGRNGWEALHRGSPLAAGQGARAAAAAALPSSPLVAVAHAQPAPAMAATPAARDDDAPAHEVRPAAPTARGAAPEPAAAATPPTSPGELVIRAVHLHEDLRVRPFDAHGKPVREAFAAIDHLMRCRITGEEVAIDPRLVRLLMLLSALYEQPIEMISGHRAPHTLNTSPDSQHVLGRAADIRIEGVSIRELRRRAVEVGARGVGLYPERGFLHVDVRTSRRYYWGYTEATGELPYDRFRAQHTSGQLASAVNVGDPESGEFE